MQFTKSETRVVRLGAGSLLIAGLLLMGWNLLSLLSGNPPVQVENIASWTEAKKLFLALSDECLSLATFCLIPGGLAIAIRLWKTGTHPILTVLGCSCMGLSLLNLSMMNVFLGRLVYPVFGIAVGSDALGLSISAYYGALHQSDLLWAAGCVLLGFSLYRSGLSFWFLVFSILVGIAELAAAYPWLLSAEFTFTARMPLVIWFLLVGICLFKR